MVLISEPSKVSTFIHNGVKLNVHAVLTCASIDGVLYVENVILGEFIFMRWHSLGQLDTIELEVHV